MGNGFDALMLVFAPGLRSAEVHHASSLRSSPCMFLACTGLAVVGVVACVGMPSEQLLVNKNSRSEKADAAGLGG